MKDKAEKSTTSALAENIRNYRKERGLTQEQLAEVLNVTTGAVHKWESGLSLPELSLIIEMAGFFNVSVDALLGYKVENNNVMQILDRLAAYCRSCDREAIVLAEKSLKRYPNSFDLAYACSDVYLIFATKSENKEEAGRALELLDHALVLLPQNKDPHIGEHTIYGKMAIAHMICGEYEKCKDLLSRNNLDGINDDSIGVILSMFMNRPEEAEPYLTSALLSGVNFILNSSIGYVFLFKAKGEYKKALEITEFTLQMLDSLNSGKAGTGSSTDFSDKIRATLMVLRAFALYNTKQKKKAADVLQAAYDLAKRFDALPNYSLDSMKFVRLSENSSFHDLMGKSSVDGISNTIRLLDDKGFSKLWEDTKHE